MRGRKVTPVIPDRLSEDSHIIHVRKNAPSKSRYVHCLVYPDQAGRIIAPSFGLLKDRTDYGIANRRGTVTGIN